MSSNPAGNDCIALAVAFVRAPSRFPDLLHGRRRLPAGVTALLQMAAGSPFRESASAPAATFPGSRSKPPGFSSNRS